MTLFGKMGLLAARPQPVPPGLRCPRALRAAVSPRGQEGLPRRVRRWVRTYRRRDQAQYRRRRRRQQQLLLLQPLQGAIELL